MSFCWRRLDVEVRFLRWYGWFAQRVALVLLVLCCVVSEKGEGLSRGYLKGKGNAAQLVDKLAVNVFRHPRLGGYFAYLVEIDPFHPAVLIGLYA